MAVSKTTARKSAYLFLAFCCVAMLAFGGIRLYQVFGPSKVVVGSVPFGIEAGTSVPAGDAPDLNAGVVDLPIQTQAELRRAMELFHAGNYRQAYEIFDAVTLLYPDVIQAIWGEVNALYSMGDLNELEQDRLSLLVGKLQGRFPGSGLSAYLDSRRAYSLRNAATALELSEVAAKKAPAMCLLRIWHAMMLQANGKYAAAVSEAKHAISLSAGNGAKPYEILAELYHQQGQLDSCAAVVNYGISQYPLDGKLLLLQGYLSEYQGNFDAAERIYQRLLALIPDYDAAAEALATIGEKKAPGTGSGANLTPKDRAEVAVEILKPLVDKYPENLPLREALALAYMKARDFDLAGNQFREIQSRDGEYPDVAQRIQECNSAKVSVAPRNEGLADDLSRAIDSLRGTMGPSKKHDFTTMLGHYLVRYGATPGEFFKKYAIENFRPVKNNVWQETFYEAPYMHTYTVVFDSLNRFREVHVTVFDSSASSNHLGIAPEIFTRLLKQNSRISGIGNSTGETDCGDGLVMDAAVWETQDNFEILARIVGKHAEVRMVRFDKSVLPPGLKLCDYATYLDQY